MAKNYWQRLQEERSKKLSNLVTELKESVQLDEAGYEHGFADPNAPQLGAQARAATKGAEMRQELGQETNNIAIAINGKTWKVVPGRGYADSKEEWSYLNNMKNWAAKKSASSGKKWTVHLTGAPVTMSEAEGVAEGFDYTMKDLGNDYAGFPSNHSMKHKMLKRIKPEKHQIYKDKMNNMHEFDQLLQLFKLAQARGDIIEQGVAEGERISNPTIPGTGNRAQSAYHPDKKPVSKPWGQTRKYAEQVAQSLFDRGFRDRGLSDHEFGTIVGNALKQFTNNGQEQVRLMNHDKDFFPLVKRNLEHLEANGVFENSSKWELVKEFTEFKEAGASTAAFRRGNDKRAQLNAMTPEERKAYDQEQQEKQRKRDDARLERERNKNKGVAEGLPQTLRKVVPGHAKREIDKKMDAGKFGKTDADKDANFQRYKKIQDKIKEQGVAEGHADQQRKIFKKNGHPVGEVGIDRDSSPGNGQWYMKCYAYNIDNSGYDSYEEAVAELKHCLKQGVAEGALDELHADLSAKFNELAPSIQKHKDVAGADHLFRELTLIAKQHNAITVFKSMLNGARNNAHMDYDTNPGGFENWFWYLPFENDLDETIGKVKGGYRLYSKKGKNLGTFSSKSGAEKHEREVQYFKHMSEDDEGAEETVDDILFKLTYTNRRIQQSDYLTEHLKDDCRTIYELLRQPLKQDDMPEYLRMLKYVQGRYPDAWDNFSDEMEGMVTEDDDGISEEELTDLLVGRFMMRFPAVAGRFGPEAVENAAADVANFHAGATELGTSDISIMLNQIAKKLNTAMQEDSWHGTGDAWHGGGNDPTNAWHGMSTAGPYISNEGKK